MNAHFKCFLGNLSHSADEASLTKALEHIESFAGCKIMYDKFDGKPRGFGWAYFNDNVGMKAATALSNRVLIHGRAVMIQPPREEGGGGDDSGAPPQKKRKPHKPIHGAIEIAHAQYAEMDKSAYQQAKQQQRRHRVVDESELADLRAGVLLPQQVRPVEAAGPGKQPPIPVRLTVRAKPKAGASLAAAKGGAQGTGPSRGAGTPSAAAPVAADAQQLAGPAASSAIALLQDYGDSDDSGSDQED